MSKHTPGPWKVVGTEIWGANVKIASGRGAYDEKDRQKNKANARLIAAAPDLLAACKTTLEMLDAEIRTAPLGRDTQPEKVTAQVLEAAIDKAEKRNDNRT